MNKILTRERLYQLLFAEDFSEFENKNWESTLDVVAGIDRNDITGKITLTNEELDYIKTIYKDILKNQETIKDVLNSVLKGYTLKQLNHSDKAVLMLSVYEMLFTDTPKKVSINEAVKLAKKFGGEKSSSFVNGVLAGVLKKIDEW